MRSKKIKNDSLQIKITTMIQRNQDKRPQAKGNARKPEIRDDLDSRENQEFRTKEQLKKAEIQNKEKDKKDKSE
jgi:hypothetical protein